MTDSEPEDKEVAENWGHQDVPFYGPKSRTVSLTGEINNHSATAFIGQLLELQDEDPATPIIIHLNTEGGSLVDAFAIYDLIKIVSCPIIIIVIGACMSAGLLILSAADQRFATPNSLFFYHQIIVSDVNIGSGEHIESMAEYYKQAQGSYDEIIRKRSRITLKKWEREFKGKTSKFFTANQAFDVGLVDQVLEFATKTKLKILESK